jgi:hypothetical protein
VIFKNGDQLIISLKEEDGNSKGKEAAQLSYGDERNIVIWHSS